VFAWLAKAGRLDETELLRTFNAGIGLVIVVDKAKADDVAAVLKAGGEQVHIIGELTKGGGAKTQAKGKGSSEAVRLTGSLSFAGAA
jgi:phosphoribosylformylglycinamidine cyclo-ligase